MSESALTTRIKSLRRAVGDDGNRQAVIRTVHGKGYEFIAPVEVVEIVDERAAEPTVPASPVGAGLPAAVQPLIGRESLLALLVDAAATHRLVILVGPGGVGKTSLGFELARTVAPRYSDGVTVVELVSVVDEDATLAAVATSIDVNLRRSSSIEDAILEMLRPRESLLVLDNCEHLIEPVASLVSRVLREAPMVSVLATSREPLAVPGEHVWSVEPLSTMGADDAGDPEPTSIPAVALFVERARAADPSFVLDGTSAPTGRDMPAPRRHTARDRARRGTGTNDRCGRDRAPARRAVRAPQGDAPRQRPTHTEASKTSSPTDLASVAVAEGFSARSPDDALQAFVTADRLARTAGNRWMSAFARTEASGLLVHRGDIAAGCAGLAETVGLWYRAGEWSQQWHTLSRCMFALHRIGQTALAVELLGAIEAHAMLAVAPMSSTLHDVVLATRDEIVDDVGTARADELRSIGESCPVEDIVDRTRKALLLRST